MLAVTFGVLNIIGLILLALLGLLLLIICLLLFVPVIYKANANADGLKVDVEAYGSWLLKFIRLSYIRKAGEERFRVYVFWFYNTRIGDKKELEAVEPDKLEYELSSSVSDQDAKENISDLLKTAEKDKAWNSRNSPASGAEKPGPDKESVIGRIKNIKRQINHYRNYPNRSRILSATWNLVKKLSKKVIPKELRITGEVGFDSPHNTAYLFAILGALMLPVAGIKPNFEEQTLTLNLYARGKLCLGSMLWPLLGYAIKPPIRQIIFDYFRSSKKNNIRKGDVDE